MSAEVVPDATPAVELTPPSESVELTPPSKSEADKSAGHVIVCGLGGIGLRITEQLRRAQ